MRHEITKDQRMRDISLEDESVVLERSSRSRITDNPVTTVSRIAWPFLGLVGISAFVRRRKW